MKDRADKVGNKFNSQIAKHIVQCKEQILVKKICGQSFSNILLNLHMK